MVDGEKFNSLTHLVGAVLALAGAVALVVLAALTGDPWKIVGVSVYGLTLVLLYSFSVLYHSLQGRAKNVLRQLDHQSIYLLIAGSYTPFCLIALRGPWGPRVSPGWRPAECSTRSASCSMRSTSGSPTRTASGTCS
jgi:hemolysin III